MSISTMEKTLRGNRREYSKEIKIRMNSGCLRCKDSQIKWFLAILYNINSNMQNVLHDGD